MGLRPTRPPRSARRRLVLAGGLLLPALALGVWLGHRGHGDATPPVRRAASGAPVRSVTRAPDPAAFAVRAVAALADPKLLSSPAARAQAARRIATTAYAPELERRLGRGYASLAEGLQDAKGLLLRIVPLGVRVEARSAHRARVAVWQVALLAVPGTKRALAAWSTTHAELRRGPGGWRVARFDPDQPGPAPGARLPVRASSPSELATFARGLRPVWP